jgi:arginase
MARVEVIGVTWSSNGLPDGVAGGIAALRSAGLIAGLREAGHDVVDGGDVALGRRTTARDPDTKLIDPAGLGSMIDAVTHATRAAVRRDRIPLVVGGDCPVMLGALRATGATGLVHVDGHEDAYLPAASPTGSAADCEVALALGWAPTPGHSDSTPLIDIRHLALVGPRDRPDLDRHRVASLADRCLLIDDRSTVADPAAAARAAAERAGAAPGGFWLHLDWDVLANDEIRAVRFPRDGGLGWAALGTIVHAALAEPRCTGWSITTYNPDLDPDGDDAARIVAFVASSLREVRRQVA